jgi:hypothetical protein
MRLLILAATFGTAAFMPTVSSAQVFRSGERVVPLLELFTSEGCSSCPPAEHWLGELRHEPGLWRDFVPVAWHVNYWDRLGWPDQFADRAYTDRQYAYAKTWRSGRVYTSGFVRAGEEWRPSSGELGSSRNAMSGGELVASVERDQVLVRFESSGAAAGLRWVNVVRLGGGIVSDVRKGENRGKQLVHEFLVHGWQREALRDGAATVRLPEALDGVKPSREAVAIWISADDSPAPIQATGGWLDRSN